jgi:DNA-binding response OmpR family regulator
MRILVVEDEQGIANFLKQGLEEESYAVDWADNGNHGLQLALTGAYDLLLLDWMLPGLSGIEICKRFRQDFQDTPVIFLTAKDTLNETISGLQSGANDYIKKPFHFEELLERIRVQLRSKTDKNQIISLGPISINPSAHQVHKDDLEIPLTQKEFVLLEFLIRNKGKVCTRTQIIESVWDIHFEYNTGVIDVYMNSLRKKLNLTESENYIQTIRGIGFMAREL